MLRLSALDLALRLKTNHQNIYKWEKGSKPSDPSEYLRLMDWLENDIKGESVESITLQERVDRYNTKADEKLSNLALLNLTESNKALAESNKDLAKAHLQLTENNHLLTAAVLKNTVNGDPGTSPDVIATLQALQEYTAEISAQLNKTTVQKAGAVLGTKMTEKLKALQKKGTRAGADK